MLSWFRPVSNTVAVDTHINTVCQYLKDLLYKEVLYHKNLEACDQVHAHRQVLLQLYSRLTYLRTDGMPADPQLQNALTQAAEQATVLYPMAGVWDAPSNALDNILHLWQQSLDKLNRCISPTLWG